MNQEPSLILTVLPRELFVIIFGFLPNQDFFHCREVCKAFFDFCSRVKFDTFQVSELPWANPIRTTNILYAPPFFGWFSRTKTVSFCRCNFSSFFVSSISQIFPQLEDITFTDCTGLDDQNMINWMQHSNIKNLEIFFEEYSDMPNFSGEFLKYLPKTLTGLSLSDLHVSIPGAFNMPDLPLLTCITTYGPFTLIPRHQMVFLKHVSLNFNELGSEVLTSYQEFCPNIVSFEWRDLPDEISYLNLTDIENFYNACQNLTWGNFQDHSLPLHTEEDPNPFWIPENIQNLVEHLDKRDQQLVF